ncbi:uncharacterized protein LOC118765724 [Octopus sinensis]|uniref:Uncharacterized protein LOC118765724 n=1 Tax=Octopus sinensis TaxID=2607531 RepID=A0A7E6F881_9MOLL|nr:uncharacterized protein LOC118765724 [Octopus sinensis]
MLSTVKPFTQRQRSDIRPSTDDSSRNFRQPARNKIAQRTSNLRAERCAMLVARGDCNFYRCFDETHTCPADQNFAFNVGNHLCRQVESFINFFDEKSKEYLRNVKRCHMAAFIPTLKSSAPTCSQIEVTGFDILNGGILPLNHVDKSCFFQHGAFCRLIEDPQNTQLFYDLYGGHGYTEYRLFVHFVKLLEHCSQTARQSFNNHYASKFVIYDEFE